MRRITRFFILLLIFFSFATFLNATNTSIVNAQCQSDTDCDQTANPAYGCYPGGWCCRCTCGNGSLSDYGDFDCEDLNGCVIDPTTGSCMRYGCLPCPGGPPGPTSPPAATPTPACCSGSPGCGNWNSDYENCIGYSCNWNPSCPGPTIVGAVWVCQRPGSIDPSNICGQVQLSCPNPDVPGGLCYTTQNTCIANCHPYPTNPITPRPQIASLCYYAAGQIGVYTAIGCVPTDNNNELIAFVLRWSLGVGGGITFLLIVYSGFIIMTSAGNTEKTKAGKELLTAAITGLMILIFSVFILDFFGLRILRIPGL